MSLTAGMQFCDPIHREDTQTLIEDPSCGEIGTLLLLLLRWCISAAVTIAVRRVPAYYAAASVRVSCFGVSTLGKWQDVEVGRPQPAAEIWRSLYFYGVVGQTYKSIRVVLLLAFFGILGRVHWVRLVCVVGWQAIDVGITEGILIVWGSSRRNPIWVHNNWNAIWRGRKLLRDCNYSLYCDIVQWNKVYIERFW